jgi:hypothetical protein
MESPALSIRFLLSVLLAVGAYHVAVAQSPGDLAPKEFRETISQKQVKKQRR